MNSKREILQKYISSLETNVKQKSDEWHKLRSKSIGGSEIASLLGMNYFQSPIQLVANKVGIGSKFEGNVATRWGNLFESVTCRWIRHVLQMEDKIEDVGCIVGCVPGQVYSPDGLGIGIIRGILSIILFEFKSPLRSIPGNVIPKHYIPQVKTGLSTIDITDLGLFVNNTFRKCKLDDLGFNAQYDFDFHMDHKKKKVLKEVYSCGIIYFYKETAGKDYYSDEKNDTHIDMGSIGEEQFNDILMMLETGELLCKYSPMIHNYNVINKHNFLKKNGISFIVDKIAPNPNIECRSYLSKFKKSCILKNYQFYGFLPWKLYISKIIIQEKDDAWKEVIRGPVKEAVENINKILESSDKEKTYKSIYFNDNVDNDDIIDYDLDAGQDNLGDPDQDAEDAEQDGEQDAEQLIGMEIDNDDIMDI